MKITELAASPGNRPGQMSITRSREQPAQFASLLIRGRVEFGAPMLQGPL